MGDGSCGVTSPDDANSPRMLTAIARPANRGAGLKMIAISSVAVQKPGTSANPAHADAVRPAVCSSRTTLATGLDSLQSRSNVPTCPNSEWSVCKKYRAARLNCLQACKQSSLLAPQDCRNWANTSEMAYLTTTISTSPSRRKTLSPTSLPWRSSCRSTVAFPEAQIPDADPAQELRQHGIVERDSPLDCVDVQPETGL